MPHTVSAADEQCATNWYDKGNRTNGVLTDPVMHTCCGAAGRLLHNCVDRARQQKQLSLRNTQMP